MTDERQGIDQITELPANQISMKRGFPIYRTNPSVPATNDSQQTISGAWRQGPR